MLSSPLIWTNEIQSALGIALEAIKKLQLLQNAAGQMLADTHLHPRHTYALSIAETAKLTYLIRER